MFRGRVTYPRKNRATKKIPAVKRVEDMTASQIKKEVNKGIDERRDVQTPSVKMGTAMRWTVLEFGKFAVTRFDIEGNRVKNPIMNTKGTPDTYWVKDKVHFWIEFKKPGGRLSADQAELIARLRLAGEVVHVLDSVGQVYELLRSLDKPRHEQLTGLKQVIV